MRRIYLNDFFKRNCCFYIAIFTCLSAVLADNCFSVPISVSSVNNCQNGYCRTNQVADISVAAVSGSKSCLVFKDFSTGAIVKTINITVTAANFVFNVDSCYHTDDISVSSVGFCGCPLGTSVSCSACPVTVPGNGPIGCTGGVHGGIGCPIQETGPYCVLTRFSGDRRYKVCQINQQINYDFSIQVDDGNFTDLVSFRGLYSETLNSDMFANVSVISTSAVSPDFVQYVVYDKHDNSDFYLLTPSEVNGINDFDLTKIGWSKIKSSSNITIPPSIYNSISARVKDCGQNTFNLVYPYLQPGVILHNHRNRLSKSLPYKSIFSDDEILIEPFGVPDTVPNHPESPIPPLVDGIAYHSDVNVPFVLLGLNNINEEAGSLLSDTTSGFIQRFPNSPAGTKTTVNITSNQMITRGNFCPYDSNCSGGATQYSFACICNDVEKYCNWCIRNATSKACEYNKKIKVLLYPGDRATLVSVDSETGHLVFDDTDVSSQPSQLILASMVGDLKMLVTFSNYSIFFASSIASPVINSVVQDNEFIIVTALSKTSPGDCVIASNPAGVISAQKISLTTSPNDYRFPIGSIVNGTVNIDIRCTENLASKSFTIDHSQVPDVVSDFPKTVTPGFANFDDWTQIFSHGAIGSAFDPFDDFNLGTILTWVVAALILVSVVVVSIMLLKWYRKRKYIVNRPKYW